MAAPTVAWDSIAPADIVLRGNDIPMLIAQAIPVAPTLVKWVSDVNGGPAIDGGGIPTAGDITTWTDRTLSTSPACFAYDGKPHYPTKPSTAVVDDTWFLAFDFASAGIILDCGLLIGHNFDTLNLTGLVFQVADSANFQTNLRTIASWTLRGGDKRISDIALTHGAEDPELRYKDVRYGWLKLTKGANFVPEVSELILGRSRQLENSLLLPHDDLALEHAIDEIESDDGVISGNVRYQRRRDLIGRLLLSESAGVADIRSWYRQVRASFAWIQEPDAAPNDWQLMWLRSKMRAQHAGFTSRILPIDAVEQGPERLFLDMETI